MLTRLASRRPSGRRGFTLIELLVVISIIALLASLILPAINAARRSARKAQCLNHIRNVGIAVMNAASQDADRVPLLEDGSYSWVRRILPAMDESALDRAILDGTILLDGTATIPNTGVPAAAANALAPKVTVLTCPDDNTAWEQPGGLSYVANAGYIVGGNWGATNLAHGTIPDLYGSSITTPAALTSSQQLTLMRATGVFWRRGGASAGTDDGWRQSLDRIGQGDGQSHTLMLSENVQGQLWWTRHTGNIAFGLHLAAAEDMQATPQTTIGAGGIDALQITEPASGTPPYGIQADSTINGNSFPNSPVSATEGALPRPSSFHVGTVNVFYCDGHADSVSDKIDLKTWAEMISSDARRYGQTN